MKKEEVLSLLERFPDLVDSDDLIQDLFNEATGEPSEGDRPSRAMPRELVGRGSWDEEASRRPR